LFSQLTFPVLNVLSVYDTAVDMDVAYEFSRTVGTAGRGTSKLVLFTGPDATDAKGRPLDPAFFPNDTTMIEIGELRHASVLLKPTNNDFTPETNPKYAVMAREIRRFIQKRLQ
jgi:hypothetical protein